MQNEEKTVFSRLLAPRKLEKLPLHIEIAATPLECETLADRFDLLSLSSFEATVDIERVHGSDYLGADCLKVMGTLRAVARQRCVVTLEPVEERIEESFEALFELRDAKARREIPGEEENDDPLAEVVEPLGPAGLDVGDLAAQHLSLALEPYPRGEGVQFDQVWPDPDNEKEESRSPFAVLRHLKKEP